MLVVNEFLSILFWLNRQKASKDGQVPIWVRITINGNRDGFSYGKKIHPDAWDEKAPVNSNVRYNAYIKEVATICGIRKELTTHTARHTFATTVLLENDVPIETVAKLLGHKDMRSTQIYAKITKRKISNNMQALESKIFGEQGLLKVL